MAEQILLIGKEEETELKISLSKMLYKKGFDQIKISKILDITQPAVSKYLSSDKRTSEKIRHHAELLLDTLQFTGYKPEFMSAVLFTRAEGEFYIAKSDELIDDKKRLALKQMNDAFAMLKGVQINHLVPQVKMNLACSLPAAKNPSEVCSFSGGMIIIDDKVSSVTTVEFGKSRHLAGLLLYIKSVYPMVNSIMNIRLNQRIYSLRTRYAMLTSDFKLSEVPANAPDILVHEGDFGIEPCAYVLAESPMEIVNKFTYLNDKLATR